MAVGQTLLCVVYVRYSGGIGCLSADIAVCGGCGWLEMGYIERGGFLV